MGISGNLKTMSLPDIFQWLHIGAKTGTLVVEREAITKKIFFEEGHVVSSFSNNPMEYFGQFLLNQQKITEEQLQEAMGKQTESGTMIGRIFVDDGLLTEEEVRGVLTLKSEETIYDLFLWPEGAFEFIDNMSLTGPQVNISLTIDKITFEGIRRVDEWKRIRKVFPSGHVVLKLNPASIPAELRGDAKATRILALVARGRSLLEIGLETRSSEFQISKILYDWHRQGFLEIAEIREQPAPEPKAPVESDEDKRHKAIQALFDQAKVALKDRNFEAALTDVSRVLEIDPANSQARSGLTEITEHYRKYLNAYFSEGARIPKLTVSLQDLMTRRTDFTPEEGFIVSRVNGIWNVQSIIKVSPIPELHALRILKRLEEEGIIRF